MTQEEKARAYDKALERARALYSQGAPDSLTLESMFPELKEESEDERMIKALKEGFKYHQLFNPTFGGIPCIEIVNWLERKPQGKTALEAIKEEKVDNANNLEPMFKVGDWVIRSIKNEKRIGIVTEILPEHYIINFDGWREQIPIIYGDCIDIRLWTIQDAKEGDVLVDEDINVIGIFEGIEGMCWHSKFYYSSTTKEFYGIECGGSHQKEFAKPATKEQRDLLFSKMKEAGYEWDAEKKELKKINSYCQEHCKGYQETGKCYADGDCEAKKLAESTWSEEDEYVYNEILSRVANKTIYQHDLEYIHTWLESFKNRIQPQTTWKPSEEIMKGLNEIINKLAISPVIHEHGYLYDLMVNLRKKLKGE